MYKWGFLEDKIIHDILLLELHKKLVCYDYNVLDISYKQFCISMDNF